MHQTHHWNCPRCKEKISSWNLRDGTLKCPDADNWRRVIESKLPQCETSEQADEISSAIRKLGLASSGYHSIPGNKYVVSILIIEDTLEALMRHEAFDGAIYHPYNSEVMCQKCVTQVKKDAYDGTDTIPVVNCPICKAVMI